MSIFISWQYPILLLSVSFIASLFLFRIGRVPFSLLIFAVVMMIGYVLEPLLAELYQVNVGFWASRKHINIVTHWSILATGLFIVGYICNELLRLGIQPKIGVTRLTLSSVKKIKCLDPIVFLVVVILIICLMLTVEGGVTKVWYSPFSKGYGQFRMGGLERVLNSVLGLLIVTIPFFAAVHWFKINNLSGRLKILLSVLIVVVYHLHHFSRWSFLPLFFFVLTLLILSPNHKKILICSLLFILALFGFWLGIRMREHAYGVGLVYYTQLSFLLEPRSISLGEELVDFAGTLSGTNVAAMIIQHNGVGGRSHQLLEYLILLLPLPSNIALPLSGINTSLSHDLRKFGSGLPYSALPEMLVFLGNKVAAVMFFFGFGASILDNYFFSNRRNYIIGSAVLFAMLLGYIISIHSGVRSSTRMILYLLSTYVIMLIFRRFNKAVFYGKGTKIR